MRTFLRIWLVLLAFSPLMVSAQAPGASFSCDGTFYQVRQIGSGASAFSALYVVDRSTNPYTTTAYTFGGTSTTGSLGVVVNALAYNPLDSYLYALAYPADNGTTPATINLYRIGQAGIQNLGATSLPSAQYNSGTIDKQGNYYLTTRGSAGVRTTSLFRLNLTNFSTVLTTFDEYPLVNSAGTSVEGGYTDIALNPKDDALYGVDLLGNLAKIVVTTANGTTRGVVTDINSSSTSTDIFGSSFFDVAGNLYTYSNSGGIYLINQSNGTATSIGSASSAPNSDGASCINPSQLIDVVKEVTGVTFSTSGTGGNTVRRYDVTFAVRVKNTGTATATNIQVTDFLSSTFPAATNFSYAILTAPAVTNYGVNGAAAPTLAASTNFTGSNAAADLLTGNQALTAGQSALITFTVRLSYASNSTPPATPYSNTAYASSTSGNGNPGYQISGGLIVPPGNLLASDESTDGAGFPAVANDDTPTPTPVFLGTSISGTVFEDYNYGGGAGRSQATSGGAGVAGATVELCNAGNTIVATTTTNASGSYVFTALANGNALSSNTTYRVRVPNTTVRSSRTGSVASLVAVQTFVSNGVTDNPNQVGGARPNEADYNAFGSGTLPASTASTTQEVQTLITLTTPASGPRVGVDAGFNFSTIVNTNESGQGSLRQFILNSNALGDEGALAQAGSNTTGTLPAGQETSIFMIPDGTARPGFLAFNPLGGGGPASQLTNGVAVIALTAVPPAISGSNTRIDGTTQTQNIGDNNTGTLGTGGTVGTAGTALPTLNRPEVEVSISNSVVGYGISGDNVTVTGIATYGSSGNLMLLTGNNLNITGNALGTTAQSFADPGNTRTPNFQIRVTQGSGTSITRNLIGYANNSGVVLQSTATNVTLTGNEIRGNGVGTVAADGVTVQIAGTTISNNLVTDNSGIGIDIEAATTLTGNTVSSNGRGLTTTAPTQTSGVRVAGANTTLTNNVLSSNYGAGVMVLNGASSILMSRNSTLLNGTVTGKLVTAAATGQLGIDLLNTTDNINRGTSPFASLNASGKTAGSGANGLLNYPIISQAKVTNTTNGNLILAGYAPAGSTIEFFVADRTTAAFGQGQTFLISMMENGTMNSVTDADTKTSSYNGTFNGLNQGSETNASRFLFTIPLSSLTADQRAALTAASARVTATSTVSDFTSEFSGSAPVGLNQPLPVTLTSFTAQAAGQDAVLTWATAQEVNNDSFVVERSLDGASFETVGKVAGQGTKATASSYRFVDARVAAKAAGQLLYYRLRQIDTDGTQSMTTIQTVRFSASGKLAAELYPTAVTATTDAQLDLTALPQGPYQVTLTDMTGRVVRTFVQAGGSSVALQATRLTAGTYIVQVKGQEQTLVKRFVKE